ncbi:ATP-binding cassette domain-containing protein [Sedimentibacter hydroxybenzoicus DSM 7310]|uniref:ATP-binding cassette domain-containing protein n=1 Tax=Sedimentibacter hydroxybenzoicus DSM 7310 TaxID=1123245 RepID=A0A974BLI4_SEDHY|nr:ATP-binding cassette domain-containing protein [Sedimentibacter hydroxybenzoicus]NYB75570.1 ATP-binding cassette domain-containing protein [Sedimentibacter hydroxybenzoicus DSM 7310]
MAEIILKDVTKIYPNGFKALEDFSLKITDKEFLVLVGPSGCGKTTILRIIAGLEEASAGDVIIGDRRVNDVLPKDRNISMVFQNYALYPHMNVYENMAFSLKLRKIGKKEIQEKILNIAGILEIEDILYKKPATLSGGQKQRAALGRAIIREPDIFLFDEPLSNIDAKLRTQMRIELINLHKRLGTTFIYVTHDQTEAMTMGERIAVMKDGIIQQMDTPENIYKNPVNIFTAGFIGSPQMNFIKDSDKNIIMGVRPEKLKISSVEPEESSLSLDQCYVEAVELIGSEKLIYFDCNGLKLISKVPEDIQTIKGNSYKLYCLKKDIHYFDGEKGEKLYYEKI